MSPLDLMFWAVAGVVALGALALAVIIVAGVIRAFIPPKRKPPRSTQIMRGGDDG